MKLLRALLGLFGSPASDIWFGGYFLCRFLWLVKDYPHSGRTAWDIAYVVIIGIAAVYLSTRGIRRFRKGRA